MVTVRLNFMEWFLAAAVGALRRIESERRKCFDKRARTASCPPCNSKGRAPLHRNAKWGIDVEGAAAEIAVAKVLGIPGYLPSVNSFRGADIDPDIQVRSTPDLRGRLILRPGDNPEHRYVLVTGVSPTFAVLGWITGREGMIDQFWRETEADRRLNRPPAWFVPREALHPMEPKGQGHTPIDTTTWLDRAMEAVRPLAAAY